MGKTIKTVIKLRRNNLYNYEKIQDTFIPMDGEICLVDTPSSGLRVKCGDGTTPFSQLDYTDTVVNLGYYSDGKFYADSRFTTELEKNTNKIYIDLASAKLYIYDDTGYRVTAAEAPTATSEIPGVMKLYAETGENEDGTMTQKSITDEIHKKMSASIDGEVISFE